MKIIVTGAAGFIGYHLVRRLLAEDRQVLAIDNFNSYYDVGLKHARLEQLGEHGGLRFVEADICDPDAIVELFRKNRDARVVVHLAAQAGVRASLTHPFNYVDANVRGQLSILEAARHLPNLHHLVYASSSSVYGDNSELPFAETDRVEKPVSLYAATKRAGELMAWTYAHLRGLPATGLRFFTVYGPWGRPDMAYYSFTGAILRGEPIDVFNEGRMRRDFTYIDDIIDGVAAAMERPPGESPPHRVYNLGNHRAEKLLDFIACLEEACGTKAELRLQPMQPGDVTETYADIEAARRDLGFSPKTSIREGLPRFVEWYRSYYDL